MSTPDMEALEAPLAGDQPRTSQLILGADRRNPVFSVYRDTDREELQVYFGFELIETLAEVPESPGCKLLVARLYNAGFKVKSLSEVFAVDPKTIRRWGVALRSGDADELIRVLEGRVVPVAILTDDTSRPAKEIILLMFQRWLQENDVKVRHEVAQVIV